MLPNEVVEEYVCRNETVGRLERIKTSLGFIPYFELPIKDLKNIVID